MDAESSRDEQVPGWVLLNPDVVPEKWRDRAKLVALIPLTLTEADQLLTEGTAEPSLDGEDLKLVRLLAKGRTAAQIADALSFSTRTVYRRVTQLRGQFGASNMEELAAELARRGF